MGNSSGRLKRAFTGFRRLHLMLYVLFAWMLGLGGMTAALLEQYSVTDFKSSLREVRRGVEAEERGETYVEDKAALQRAFKPLGLKNFNVQIDAGNRKKKYEAFVEAGDKTKKNELKISFSESGPLWAMLLILFWLWPLYRHYFSRTPQDLARIERRIMGLPLFLFALTWLAAVGHFFSNLGTYRTLYGEPSLRLKSTFAAGAVLMGAFAGYLNLEVTQLYIRRWIALPFFREHNPHGLKRGLRVGLTARYALMVFSLAMVPLALCVYIPGFFNWDMIAALKNSKTTAPLFENAGVVVPLLMTMALAVLMILFQGLSVVLFRWNVQEPIAALIGRMRAVAAGDFEGKTSVLDSDEIGQLKGHFNLMLDGLVEREKIKDTFGKYVSMEIAEKIMKSGKVNLAGEEIQATVLFSDIRNFTPLSEKLSPTELILFLNDYFAHVTEPIMSNRGVINKFMGDAVMALFSPIFGVEDHAEAALRAAVGMREALKRFNALGAHQPVAFGVGVHTGTLIAGNVGTESRLEYTVLGDTVNVASRIEGQTKQFATEILISDAVLRAVDRARFPGMEFAECGPVLMKGKSKSMLLYKVSSRS